MKALRLAPQDNVATLLQDIQKGESVEVLCSDNSVICTLTALQKITFGNKIAITDIKEGEDVIKGGHSIGKAIKDIPVAQLAHVQNVRSVKLNIPEAVIADIIKQMEIEE